MSRKAFSRFLPFGNNLHRLGNLSQAGPELWYIFLRRKKKMEETKMAKGKERFVEVYSQGLTNVEKIIVDTQTGVNYLLAASTLTAGCGMSVLVDAEGKPIVTPVD